jgi:hypothetical protein
LISNGVPAKKIAGGKNSSIDGPWNPPSSPAAALAIRDATCVISAGSSYRRRTSGATMDMSAIVPGMTIQPAILAPFAMTSSP